jgi:hypothetical protein
MAETLFTYKFWMLIAGSTITVFAIGCILAAYWGKGVHQCELHWEAFSSPSNNAVTVAGVVMPLIAGLFAYSVSTLKQNPEQLSSLAASMVLMGLSIIFGLWISFSLATASGKEGTFQISAKKNTFYPAFLVSQLALLLLGFFLVVYYCFSGLSAPLNQKTEVVSKSTSISLFKPPLSVGTAEEDVIKIWGEPLERLATPQGEQLKYISIKSEFLIKIAGSEIVEITERKKSLE